MGQTARGMAGAALLLGAAARLDGQVLHGQLREEGTNQPVPAAFVILLDSTGARDRQTFTDSIGRFQFPAIAAGSYRVRVERVGYASVHSEPIRVTAADSTPILLYLSVDAVRLAPLVVADPRSSRLDRFYENRARFGKLGIGDFLGPTELALWINQPVSSALQSIPYLHAAAGRPARLGTRSRRCRISYYLDGVRLRTLFGQSIDDILRVIDLEGIEAYRGQAQLPAEYSDAQSRGCPVVAFWTRRTR